MTTPKTTITKRLLPRFVGHYRCGKHRFTPCVQYSRGDDVWADTIHLHLFWRGKSHWWLFALPDWMCRKSRNVV